MTISYQLNASNASRSESKVRASAVYLPERKLYWWSDNRSRDSKCLVRDKFINDSKTLLMVERRLIGLYFRGLDLSPEFLNTGTADTYFQQEGKKDTSMHFLKTYRGWERVLVSIYAERLQGFHRGQ